MRETLEGFGGMRIELDLGDLDVVGSWDDGREAREGFRSADGRTGSRARALSSRRYCCRAGRGRFGVGFSTSTSSIIQRYRRVSVR